jgi:hypothetical protein
MYTAKARMAPGRRVVILEPWYATHFRTRQTDTHGGDGAVEIPARPPREWGHDLMPGILHAVAHFRRGAEGKSENVHPTN